MKKEYYQIYKNHYPLSHTVYDDIKSARRGLEYVSDVFLNYCDALGIHSERRIKVARNVSAYRCTYSDGSEERISFTIRRVSLLPRHINF
jgi:hypothetical protein